MSPFSLSARDTVAIETPARWATSRIVGLATADRGYHVEPCILTQRRLELGSFLVDVDVNVRTELPRLAQPVAQAGIALVQPFERLPDRARVNVDVPGQARKEGRQRRRDMNVHRAQSTTTASTDVVP